LGAAVLASVGAGNYDSLKLAIKEAVVIDRKIVPCSKNVEAYRQRYKLYLKVYPKLISLLRQC
jgi:sugar (pentulose or hexulose) kinase